MIMNFSKDRIRFTGEKCCLFNSDDAAQAFKNRSFEDVKDYGDVYRDADGSIKHQLHSMSYGGRTLKQCKRCGALFLVQFSALRLDDSYSDLWFQVDDETTAELINATWDGFEIAEQYDGPCMVHANEVFSFINNE